MHWFARIYVPGFVRLFLKLMLGRAFVRIACWCVCMCVHACMQSFWLPAAQQETDAVMRQSRKRAD